MNKTIPPELLNQLIELLHVVGGIVIGWIAKRLQQQTPPTPPKKERKPRIKKELPLIKLIEDEKTQGI